MTKKTVKISFAAMICLAAGAYGAGSQIIHPFQKADKYRPNNKIDEIVVAALAQKKLEPANLCSDEVFIRRAYLDITGTLPPIEEARRFLKNPRS
ncbi:MAG: DUF1549 domain-containing protein, partial [Planctomycetota bacterium]